MRQRARVGLCFLKLSNAYREHVGVYRQFVPKNGESADRYRCIKAIRKNRSALAIGLFYFETVGCL